MKTREELERENTRLRGDLRTYGSRISHDLRTPLGGIVSTGDLLAEILAEKDPASAALARSLSNSVDETTKLIRSVSLLAKASANPAAKETVAMEEIVFNVSQRLESRVLKRGAKVKTSPSWPQVEGVAEWLEFTWLNFLANALEHGGEKITLGWDKMKDGQRFWITDNGLAIAPEVRAKLFQPFDSLHEHGSTRGLSLSIIQRLVELQGGACGHEHDARRGNLIFFTLPFAETKKL